MSSISMPSRITRGWATSCCFLGMRTSGLFKGAAHHELADGRVVERKMEWDEVNRGWWLKVE